MHSKRLSALRSKLTSLSIDGLIVSKRQNIHYLTGLHQLHPTNREALLFLAGKKLLLYHSPFLTNLPTSSTISCIPMHPKNPLPSILNTHYPKTNPQKIGFEAKDFSVSEFNKFKGILVSHQLIESADLIEEIRKIKDFNEIKHIKKACSISKYCIKWAIEFTKKNAGNITELDVANQIDHQMRKKGANDNAFPTLVASDANTANPHHSPTSAPITKNSIVLIDIGCQINGYCSDTTRTIKLGKPSTPFQHIKNIVDTAYQKALHTISGIPEVARSDSSGVNTIKASTIDQAARSIIQKAGFGPNFIHTTGHALGLEIHEQPSLNSKNNHLIKPHMILTIEPGIYLKGKFGYRHENTIHITKTNPKELT